MSIISCALRSLPRSLDVPVNVSKPQTEGTTDLSTAVFVSASGSLTHGAGRIRYYSTIEAVEADWATSTNAWKAARDFMSQSPRASTMAIAQAFDTDQAGYAVTGAVGALSAFQAVTTGSFAISINGVSNDVTGLNFSTDTTLAQVAARIQAAIRAEATGGFTLATVTYTGSAFKIVSGVDGDGSSVSVLGAAVTGVDISGPTLMNGQNATLVDGYTPTGLVGELTLIAEAARCSGRFVYGWDFDAEFRDTPEMVDVVGWIQARRAWATITSNDPLAYDPDTTTDIASETAELGAYRSAMLWAPPEHANYYPGMSLMARVLAVNYSARNAHITAKFKDLPGIPTAPIDETQLSVLQSKGYNVLTAIGNNSRTFRDGETSTAPQWYIDELVDLDNFVEELQTSVLNVFLRNNVVPMSVDGQALTQDGATDTCEKYVFNGCFSERRVLDLTRKEGYRTEPAYTIEQTPPELWSDADRIERDGGTMAIDVNLTGAMHKLAINVNAFS